MFTCWWTLQVACMCIVHDIHIQWKEGFPAEIRWNPYFRWCLHHKYVFAKEMFNCFWPAYLPLIFWLWCNWWWFFFAERMSAIFLPLVIKVIIPSAITVRTAWWPALWFLLLSMFSLVLTHIYSIPGPYIAFELYYRWLKSGRLFQIWLISLSQIHLNLE